AVGGADVRAIGRRLSLRRRALSRDQGTVGQWLLSLPDVPEIFRRAAASLGGISARWIRRDQGRAEGLSLLRLGAASFLPRLRQPTHLSHGGKSDLYLGQFADPGPARSAAAAHAYMAGKSYFLVRSEGRIAALRSRGAAGRLKCDFGCGPCSVLRDPTSNRNPPSLAAVVAFATNWVRHDVEIISAGIPPPLPVR